MSESDRNRPPGAPPCPDHRPQTIAAMWGEFAAKAVKPGTPKQLRALCRLAFYAACEMLFVEVSALAGMVPDDDAGLDAGARHLQRLKDECEAYAEDIARNGGRAV